MQLKNSLPFRVLLAVFFLLGCGSSTGGGICDFAFDSSRAPQAPREDSLVLAEIRSEQSCAALLEGPRRGLSCLHCSQPEARTQAELISTLLVRSCLKNISSNYLVGGTFSFDPVFLQSQIEKLSAGERNVSVTFYLANGAAQRRSDVTRIESFATMIPPAEFRERIESDPNLQEQYRAIVRRMIPLIRFAVSRGVEVRVIPYLEDNLSDRAFEVMLAVTRQELPEELPVVFGRNPCGPACFEGNEAGIPSGVFEEIHTASAEFQTRNGIVTNDGSEYSSPATAPDPQAQTCLAQLRLVRDAAASMNNSFILWSGRRQGLPADIEAQLFPLPSERIYQSPSEAEQVEIIEFLREGLS